MATMVYYIATVFLGAWFAMLVCIQCGEYAISWRKLSADGTNAHLVRLVVKVVGIAAICTILIIGAQNLGLPTYSIVTTLGLGGFALTLAGQELLKSLFGFISILVERAFRVGDFVVIGDVEGIVEDIGFKSTTIRTAKGSLRLVPNLEVFSQSVEKGSVRNHRRYEMTISIEGDAPPDKIKAFVEGIKKIILENPRISNDYFDAALAKFGTAGLNIDIIFYVLNMKGLGESKERQSVLLEIIQLAERMGIDIAPTQMLQIMDPEPVLSQ
jgi:MscS family membrane protein